MTGTAKQIKWAEEIKAEALANVGFLASNLNTAASPRYDLEDVAKVKEMLLKSFAMTDSAAAIIDGRMGVSYEAMKQLCERLHWEKMHR